MDEKGARGTPGSPAPQRPELRRPPVTKPNRRVPRDLPYPAAALIGALVGVCYGLAGLIEGGLADGGLWFLLIGPVGGALVGIQLARRRHWADRGPEWNYARWMLAFAVAASTLIIPWRIMGDISSGDAWAVIGLAAVGGLGFALEFDDEP